MSKKSITIFFCVGLVMTCSTLRADVLKNKNDGTIVAVGRLKGADTDTIYWKTCDGDDTTFAPRKGYLYKSGNNDCRSSTVDHDREPRDSVPSRSRERASDKKDGWKEVPVTGKRRDEKVK